MRHSVCLPYGCSGPHAQQVWDGVSAAPLYPPCVTRVPSSVAISTFADLQVCEIAVLPLPCLLFHRPKCHVPGDDAATISASSLSGIRPVNLTRLSRP